MKEFCVDLELAKELKENGFPQTYNFLWVKSWDVGGINKTIPDCGTTYLFGYNIDSDRYEIERYFAPTSDEILKELPEGIRISKNIYGYYISVIDIKITLAIRENAYKEFEDKKLTNSLAKMWLYLKKEGYIK